MKKDRLSKLYHRLTPHERFRLVVEAGARQDYIEADLLTGSCPYETYMMKEAAYQDRVQAGSIMATTAAGAWMQLAQPLAQLIDDRGLPCGPALRPD